MMLSRGFSNVRRKFDRQRLRPSQRTARVSNALLKLETRIEPATLSSVGHHATTRATEAGMLLLPPPL